MKNSLCATCKRTKNSNVVKKACVDKPACFWRLAVGCIDLISGVIPLISTLLTVFLFMITFCCLLSGRLCILRVLMRVVTKQ